MFTNYSLKSEQTLSHIYIYRIFFKKRILELKNPFDKFFSMLDTTEERLNELEDRPRKIMEVIQTE